MAQQGAATKSRHGQVPVMNLAHQSCPYSKATRGNITVNLPWVSLVPAFQARQGLKAALGLAGLGGLGAETVDKAL